MWLLSTTVGWNVGDDLIREGVLRLLGLTEADVVHLNRSRVAGGKPVFRVQDNLPPVRELVAACEGFVAAGTPEWYGVLQDVYRCCIQQRKRVACVGVGMDRPGPLLARLKTRNLLAPVSVRDQAAWRSLAAMGLSAGLFLDPAFHASYPTRGGHVRDCVLVYRAAVGNGRFSERHDEFWKGVWERWGDRVETVAVHEMPEVRMARRLFGRPVFHCSAPEPYKELYASAAACITGRIHAAVPVVACGGRACVVYSQPKIDTLHQASRLLGTGNLTFCRYENGPDGVRLGGGDDVSAPLAADFEDHREYLGKWRA